MRRLPPQVAVGPPRGQQQRHEQQRVGVVGDEQLFRVRQPIGAQPVEELGVLGREQREQRERQLALSQPQPVPEQEPAEEGRASGLASPTQTLACRARACLLSHTAPLEPVSADPACSVRALPPPPHFPWSETPARHVACTRHAACESAARRNEMGGEGKGWLPRKPSNGRRPSEHKHAAVSFFPAAPLAQLCNPDHGGRGVSLAAGARPGHGNSEGRTALGLWTSRVTRNRCTRWSPCSMPGRSRRPTSRSSCVSPMPSPVSPRRPPPCRSSPSAPPCPPSHCSPTRPPTHPPGVQPLAIAMASHSSFP